MAIGVSILVGLALVLIAVPVTVDFRIEGVQPFRGALGIRWLFGLVHLRTTLPRAGGRAPERADEPGDSIARGRPRRRERGHHVLAVLREAAFRRRVFRLASDLVHAFHVRRVRLLLRLGLGDPADTGRLWAVVGPVGAIARARGADVRIEPDFLDPVLELQADGSVAFVPLRLLHLAVAFAFSPPTLRAWRTLRGSRA